MFAHPAWLAGIAAAALLAAGYAAAARRGRRRALPFGNLATLARVAGGRRAPLRHAPAAALLAATALLAIALAGPVGETKVARNRATVMLVVDVSYSMGSADVAPDRLSAAKAAGADFIADLPADLNVGLVTFSGRARTPVAPTTDHDRVARALAGAQLDTATATGDAIMAALEAVEALDAALPGGQGPPPASVVLLSDGKQTVPSELDAPRGAYTAADEAARRGVPVSTISFGTAEGTVIIDGERVPVPTDDASLAEIATRTGGAFHAAGTAGELREAYADLAEDIGWELRRQEDPRPWTIAALAVAALGAAAAAADARRAP